MAFGWMGSTTAFGAVVRKPYTKCPGIGFVLVLRSPLNVVQMPAKANSGRSSLSADQITSFFFLCGFDGFAVHWQFLLFNRRDQTFESLAGLYPPNLQLRIVLFVCTTSAFFSFGWCGCHGASQLSRAVKGRTAPRCKS